MEDKEILELLEKLNSLDIKELDEEVAKMQVTYEQWSKLMGQKGYWSVGLSEVLLEDKEALQGERNIGFEDFKRLAKEYGMRRIELPRNATEKKIAEQSQLLEEKLEPEKKIERYKANIAYFMSCLEDETLDKEEYDEYQEKIKDCKASIKRSEDFQNARNGRTTSENSEVIDKKDTKVSKIKSNEAGEFASKIAEDEDCIYMIHGTGISAIADAKHEQVKDEDNKWELTEETLELAKKQLSSFFDEGLYLQDSINSTAVNLNELAMSNKGANEFLARGDDWMSTPKDDLDDILELMDNIIGEETSSQKTPKTELKKRPETVQGILEDYINNGYEKYQNKKVMVLLAIPKKCFTGELPLYEYDEEGKVFGGITGNATDFHKRIPKEYIKGAFLRGSDVDATYYFENSVYDKNKGEKATQGKTIINENAISDIRKQMEWFYKRQTMLTVQDINEYCTEYGLDFNYEMGQARDRVELRTELDQSDLTNSDKKSSLMMELSSKAESLGLDIGTEIEESTQRNLLRKEMRSFSEGKSEMSIDEINNRCNSLGLNFNYEMENAKMLPIAADTKNCAKSIAIGTLARDVRVSSSEIKQNYNELVNPDRATEDKSIDE